MASGTGSRQRAHGGHVRRHGRALARWLGGVAVAWGLLAHPATAAESPLPRIAFLGMDSQMQEPLVAAFRARLRALGHEEGRNVELVFRWAERRFDRLRPLADELVLMRPQVIVTAAPPAVRAVRQATTTIPTIVLVHDPVGSGFAQSLARPGGNLSGVAFQDIELSGKRLGLLRQLVPGLSRVALLWNREGGGAASLQAVEAAAAALGLDVLTLEVQRPEEMPELTRRAKAWGAQGLLQLASPVITYHRRLLLDAAARARLPMMCEMRAYVVDGCLATYSASMPAMFGMLAEHVDRVLRGTRVDTLPIEQPREFEFVVNRAAAEALGLRLSPELRLQVTELLP